MIELEVLSGKLAGKVYLVRQFPFVIGRSQTADLSSNEEGLWQRHAEIDFVPQEGFVLSAEPRAGTIVNGQPVTRIRLRPGDTIQCGALKFRVWLSAPQQKQRLTIELSVYGLLLLIFAVQLLLMHLLAE